jgi:maltodextrin utilization protein YvdJ
MSGIAAAKEASNVVTKARALPSLLTLNISMVGFKNRRWL